MSRRQPLYLLPGTVYDAALRRIRWLWDEFDGNVSVSVSGGKDSTVVLELALTVARERDALPLRVFFLDQECELQGTVDWMRQVAARPEVDFHWFQVPFRLSNSANHANEWLDVWGTSRPWVREKEPDAITVNEFGVDRFVEVLRAIGDGFGGAVLTGVRGEESPARRMGLTAYTSYKWVTWGNKNSGGHYGFHPIYDWTYRDVWKAIYDGGWLYNAVYEGQYRYGVPTRNMRVSNYHHETSLQILWWLQEVEPETWAKAVARLDGLNTVGHLNKDLFVHELPFMFRSWIEYHEHLVANLIPSETNRATFLQHRDALLRRLPYVDPEEIGKACVQAVIANDLYFTKGNQFYLTHRDQSRHKKVAAA